MTEVKNTYTKYVWLLVAIIIVVLWANLPIGISGSSPLLLSFIGGGLVCGAVIMFSKHLKSFASILLPIFTFIGFAIIFTIIFSLKESSELEKNGILTTGIVIDKSSMRAKRTTIYDLKVTFYTKNETKMTVTESVSKDQFRNIQIGDKIELIYSSSNPNIITFDTKPKNANNGLLRGSDLMMVFQLDSAGAASLLELVHWKYDISHSVWLTKDQQSIIDLKVGEKLFFTTPGFDIFEEYEKDFIAMGYKSKDRIPMNKATYTSDNYSVLLENSLYGQGRFEITITKN
ncbi:MAG: DUF3592 domain-containing protein [Crocinitomicaceae bacterium]